MRDGPRVVDLCIGLLAATSYAPNFRQGVFSDTHVQDLALNPHRLTPTGPGSLDPYYPMTLHLVGAHNLARFCVLMSRRLAPVQSPKSLFPHHISSMILLLQPVLAYIYALSCEYRLVLLTKKRVASIGRVAGSRSRKERGDCLLSRPSLGPGCAGIVYLLPL